MIYTKKCLECKVKMSRVGVTGLRKNWKFCSKKCQNSGKNNGFFGKKHSQEAINKMVICAKTREKNPMLGKKHTKETKNKIRAKAKMSTRRGKDSNLWKHGKYPEHLIQRRCSEYKVWRQEVFERDSFTCVLCTAKSTKGKKVILNADHIKPFSLYPELRFDINNGRTLCVECHRKTDTFGNNAIKKQI
jgi:hypothetical protein